MKIPVNPLNWGKNNKADPKRAMAKGALRKAGIEHPGRFLNRRGTLSEKHIQKLVKLKISKEEIHALETFKIDTRALKVQVGKAKMNTPDRSEEDTAKPGAQPDPGGDYAGQAIDTVMRGHIQFVEPGAGRTAAPKKAAPPTPPPVSDAAWRPTTRQVQQAIKAINDRMMNGGLLNKAQISHIAYDVGTMTKIKGVSLDAMIAKLDYKLDQEMSRHSMFNKDKLFESVKSDFIDAVNDQITAMQSQPKAPAATGKPDQAFSAGISQFELAPGTNPCTSIALSFVSEFHASGGHIKPDTFNLVNTMNNGVAKHTQQMAITQRHLDDEVSPEDRAAMGLDPGGVSPLTMFSATEIVNADQSVFGNLKPGGPLLSAGNGATTADVVGSLSSGKAGVFTHGDYSIFIGKESGNGPYVVFDSHNRDAAGKAVSEGSGYLLKFETAANLTQYLTDNTSTDFVFTPVAARALDPPD